MKGIIQGLLSCQQPFRMNYRKSTLSVSAHKVPSSVARSSKNHSKDRVHEKLRLKKPILSLRVPFFSRNIMWALSVIYFLVVTLKRKKTGNFLAIRWLGLCDSTTSCCYLVANLCLPPASFSFTAYTTPITPWRHNEQTA